VADAIRKGVRDAAPVLARVQFPRGTLTVSIGLVFAGAEFSRAAEDEGRVGEALFRAADDALYRAKAAGRNQVCRVFYSLSARVS
jgi:PleD family two-component response regulator